MNSSPPNVAVWLTTKNRVVTEKLTPQANYPYMDPGGSFVLSGERGVTGLYSETKFDYDMCKVHFNIILSMALSCVKVFLPVLCMHFFLRYDHFSLIADKIFPQTGPSILSVSTC